MKYGDLATRIKLYEKAAHHHLPPNSYVFIRVDGKALLAPGWIPAALGVGYWVAALVAVLLRAKTKK